MAQWLQVREEMESSLQKLHEANAAMLTMVLSALKLFGAGKSEEASSMLQRLIALMESIETVW